MEGGVPQDYNQAVTWVRRAADQGHVRAQFNLGASYDTGAGVEKNASEALRWFRRAADLR